MDIQNLILDHYIILLLIAGSLLLWLGLTPILSKKYYDKNWGSKEEKDNWLFSKKDGYIYGRYIRHTEPILIGIILIAMAVYAFLNDVKIN